MAERLAAFEKYYTWIDPAGLRTGMIFWRFLLPEENPPPIETELVDVGSLS
mgnify:CR=1 FL=1